MRTSYPFLQFGAIALGVIATIGTLWRRVHRDSSARFLGLSVLFLLSAGLVVLHQRLTDPYALGPMIIVTMAPLAGFLGAIMKAYALRRSRPGSVT